MAENRRDRYRIDFKTDYREIGEKDGKIVYQFAMVPDPERYEWKDIDGEKVLFDKFDKIAIPKRALEDAARRMEGMPIYFRPPKISDARQYISTRLPEIRRRLRGERPPQALVDKSEEFLQSLETDELGFVILSVDLVGSTKLSHDLDAKRYATLISTFLWELSNLVAQFNGHVLKYTGDGIIGYFPEPSFSSQNDNAVDCAISIRALVQEMNGVLETEGFPRINVRQGIESGDAAIVTIGSPETKQHKDIIGTIVSMAAKIQSSAQHGGLSLGEVATRNVHVQYRKNCVEQEAKPAWPYNHPDGTPYRVFRYAFRWVAR